MFTTIMFAISQILFLAVLLIGVPLLVIFLVDKIREMKKKDTTAEPPVDTEDGDNNSDETDTDEDGEGTSTTSEEEVKPCTACPEAGSLEVAKDAKNTANDAVDAANDAKKIANDALEANQATSKKVEKLSAEQRERYREATKDKRDSLTLKIANLTARISSNEAAVTAYQVIQGQLVEKQNIVKEGKEKADNITNASAILHDHSAVNNASLQRTVRLAEKESEEVAVETEERLNAANEKQNSKLGDHQSADENSTEFAKAIAELQEEIESNQKEINALYEEIITLSKELNAAKVELEELDKPLKA